jgi:hypothetical protein
MALLIMTYGSNILLFSSLLSTYVKYDLHQKSPKTCSCNNNHACKPAGKTSIDPITSRAITLVCICCLHLAPRKVLGRPHNVSKSPYDWGGVAPYDDSPPSIARQDSTERTKSGERKRLCAVWAISATKGDMTSGYGEALIPMYIPEKASLTLRCTPFPSPRIGT